MLANRLCRAAVLLTIVVGILPRGAVSSASAVELPQKHPYQKQLRDYLATLSARDFQHGVSEKLSRVPGSDDPDDQLRNYALTLMGQPLVGTKRGPPAVNAPATLFTLAGIEGETICMPPVYPETLASFVAWNYPGNPYYGNRALKLRAFVTAVVMLVMTDNYLDEQPPVGPSDQFHSQLIYTSSGYLAAKELLPREARVAFETGLKRLGQRILDWDVRGEAFQLDLVAPVALWYVAKATEDTAFAQQAEARARKLFVDERYFHPAGYFVDRGGLDVGYQGSANYFACGAALAADWPFAKEAINRIYRLRAHLCLPEPDGKYVGPSQFNTKIGSDAWGDQWSWNGSRDFGAAMITDEAVYLARLPSAETLAAAAATRANIYNGQIAENPVRRDGSGFLKNEEITPNPWSRRLWTSYHFPASVNFGYEFYRPGTYARLAKLQRENSPLLVSPYLRAESFVRPFEKAFVAVKQPGYAAVVHTGPVGRQDPDDGLQQFAGPLGLGGGELSAFWTPSTGSVLLGRRIGMNSKGTFDKVEAWRTWPHHAVCGCTSEGKFFTSGRIVTPAVTYDIQANRATMRVAGVIPADVVLGHRALAGRIDYARRFDLDERGATVETTLSGDGQDRVAELYEVLPVFLREAALQRTATPTTIEFQTTGGWTTATEAYAERVQAVRLTRFAGAVQVTFDRPRRAKLSPADWSDTFISRAACRNVLIDLQETGDQPSALTTPCTIRYRIEPATK